MKAVVLLPTYNERDNVQSIVPAILNAAPVDVWILDDASPDGTGALADALAQQDGRVRVMHRPKKLGLGRAYLDGFSAACGAGYDRIIEMDADFSHPPQHLPEMLRLAQEHHLVLASRWVKGGGTHNWSLGRRCISRWGSFYARSILGVPVRDLTGGFRCYQRTALETLDLSRVRSCGYAFQIEMAYRVLKQGLRVVEMPFVFEERRAGKSKMSRQIVMEAIWRVPQLRWEDRG